MKARKGKRKPRPELPAFAGLRQRLTTPEAIALHEQTWVAICGLVELEVVNQEVFGGGLPVSSSLRPYMRLMARMVSASSPRPRGHA